MTGALLDRRLLIVTGKGGVGKSTVAAALGLLAARQGKRTLVCEIDAGGGLAAAFEREPLSYEPIELDDDLFGMVMDTEESLREYIKLNVRIPLIGRIGPLARSFDFVANAAPGVKEILTIGKLAWEVRENNYDIVIADAPATGHVVSQLSSPAAIRDLVQVGLVREQTDWMLDILTDTAQTGAVIVAAPEEMPVSETLELAHSLDAETDVALATVIVNRVLPELFGTREESVFVKMSKPARKKALDVLGEGDTDPVVRAAQLAVSLRRTRAGHINRLRDELPPEVPLVYLPYLFARAYGVRSTSRLSTHLGEELL